MNYVNSCGILYHMYNHGMQSDLLMYCKSETIGGLLSENICPKRNDSVLKLSMHINLDSRLFEKHASVYTSLC